MFRVDGGLLLVFFRCLVFDDVVVCLALGVVRCVLSVSDCLLLFVGY